MPTTRLPENAALLVIDVQEGFDDPEWGRRNNPYAEENIFALLGVWRRTERPVFHVRHLSLRPGSPLEAKKTSSRIKPVLAPFFDEPVIEKHVNSAFIGTDLESRLRARNVGQLVVAGLTTDHCISTSVRMAANLGFAVQCVSDATATFDRIGPTGRHHSAEEIHDVHLASLSDEFATIVKTADVLRAARQGINPLARCLILLNG